MTNETRKNEIRRDTEFEWADIQAYALALVEEAKVFFSNNSNESVILKEVRVWLSRLFSKYDGNDLNVPFFFEQVVILISLFMLYMLNTTKHEPEYICDYILESSPKRITAPGVDKIVELPAVDKIIEWAATQDKVIGNGFTIADLVDRLKRNSICSADKETREIIYRETFKVAKLWSSKSTM